MCADIILDHASEHITRLQTQIVQLENEKESLHKLLVRDNFLVLSFMSFLRWNMSLPIFLMFLIRCMVAKVEKKKRGCHFHFLQKMITILHLWVFVIFEWMAKKCNVFLFLLCVMHLDNLGSWSVGFPTHLWGYVDHVVSSCFVDYCIGNVLSSRQFLKCMFKMTAELLLRGAT